MKRLDQTSRRPTGRIALVLDRFDPGRGGAEAYLDRFARFLTERNHSVTLITGEGMGETSNVDRPYTIEELPVSGRSRYRRERYLVEQMRRRCEECGFDAVLGLRHTDFVTVYNPHGGLFCDAIARSSASSGAPRWLQPVRGFARRLNPIIRYFLEVERRIAADPAVLIVAVSEMVARRWEEVYRVPRTRIRVIFNGVDLDRFRPGDEARRDSARRSLRRRLGLCDDAFVMLFVGHNFRLKGLPMAMKVLAGSRKRNRKIALVVCGRGKTPKEYTSKSRASEDSVAFVGESDRPEDLCVAADVLIHPTYYDPCSLVVLEALASGLPVVTTRWNGASEALGATGAEGSVVVEGPESLREMEDAVVRLAGDDSLRRRAGVAARRAVEGLSWEGRLEAMEEVLIREGGS